MNYFKFYFNLLLSISNKGTMAPGVTWHYTMNIFVLEYRNFQTT